MNMKIYKCNNIKLIVVTLISLLVLAGVIAIAFQGITDENPWFMFIFIIPYLYIAYDARDANF